MLDQPTAPFLHTEWMEWTLSSEAGSEQKAVDAFNTVAQALPLRQQRLITFQLAVAEAVRNAIEHGNQFRSDLVVKLWVQVSLTTLIVRITDQGTHGCISEPPDLEAKFAQPQTERGWGLLLIKQAVDQWRFHNEATGHTLELTLDLERMLETEGAPDAGEHDGEMHEDEGEER